MGLTSLGENIVGFPKHYKPTKPYQRYRLNSIKVCSSRYYPNLNRFYSNNVVFASACMYCSSRYISYSAVEISPTQSPTKFTAQLMGIPPLESNREPNSVAGIFLLGA